MNKSKPSYMEQLLDQLGWNTGTRIPLANPDNQQLENVLISRQEEIQRLKEEIIQQNIKTKDLKNYKQHVTTEYQENTRLLFAHKQQFEQEVKLKQLACIEADGLDREIVENSKKNTDVSDRLDKLQVKIARLLKKADSLKTEVCGERGALQEWRAALERNAGDITALEQFTKQDVSKAKALEMKRQKLKMEHDHMHDSLNQLVSNLNAEERSCDRISIQVIEGLEQRQHMMTMWSNAVENLRQRDTDIRHIREDYAVLEEESNRVAEQCREQQAFYDQQRGNNAEAARENAALTQRLGQLRQAQMQLVDQNVTLNSEAECLQREVYNVRASLEKLRMENKQILEEQMKKEQFLKTVVDKLNELREKKTESLDKTKSSEKRAKQLEEILNDEERYTSQLTTNQQRAMHCSFVEQQKLLALKNEQKLFHMQIKASKASFCKLDSKQNSIEKNLLHLKENLYAITYQSEMVGTRVSHMEGARASREFSAELLARERRLRGVAARHAARLALLERQTAGLQDGMRRLARDLERDVLVHTKLQNLLKSNILNVEGGEKEVRASRAEWRRMRVEEALTRLRVAHAARALAALGDAALSIDEQRLNLDAAMNERIIEISARRDMFSVQKRALFEDCGKLRCDIREREQRIEQLKKRYDIFIASLGKDDSGRQLSVTFFKIKFAAERAELRERGAALDAAIARGERDIAALEATLRVMHAAHAHFVHHITPLDQDTPEIEELYSLNGQYYDMRDELKALRARAAAARDALARVSERHAALAAQHGQLVARESEMETDVDGAHDRLTRQESKLDNAKEQVRHVAKRAKILIDNKYQWRIFQMALWVREYWDSCFNALRSLKQACGAALEPARRLSVLLTDSDIQLQLPKHQRQLQSCLMRIITATHSPALTEEMSEDSIISKVPSSCRSEMSIMSGITRRLNAFRQTLAETVDEPELAVQHNLPSHMSSLRVITLGLEDSLSIHIERSSRSKSTGQASKKI